MAVPGTDHEQPAAEAQRLGERLREMTRTRTFLIATLIVILALMYLFGALSGAGSRLMSLTAWGLMLGGVIALGSIGLTLVYGVMKFPNFSHGALVTLGAYVTYTVLPLLPDGPTLSPLSFGYEFLVAMVVAMPVVGAVAIALDRAVYRRLRRTGSHLVLFAMASLAMAFFLRSLIYLIWGPDFHFYYPGQPNPAFRLPLNIRVQGDQVFILVMAFVFVAGVSALLEWTKMGKAMRATADNPDLAGVRGINTERVIAWTWGLGGALAACGGVMYGLSSQLRPEMGFWLLLPMFAATIMGGIGNPYGALIAALIIGISHQVSTSFLDPTYGPAVAFVLMVITLLIRPQGLLGRDGG
ncbi:branched-chain amino acid ABC transporter permease [Aquisalimonas lutea]|uniref:branched-chain amino acid ABC transporter permease n=1 Tax=Aquisalimonas lutea TaxID=1327750 RepID=UPI0025B4E093|nr:branched-chain amino acid ABC transporter permease [Aquisalimonas lutea]MDN3518890.1 branched-chain amino acid ABC transporter permease [Aquisalimonas lutea]